MIFLAGLGDTGHSFDEFALPFRDSFHPIAITRRGFGASGHPDSGYDSARRARDILDVMDSLHIDRAILVGHSVAGDELSRFAVDYPQRVQALIYLDAYSYGRDWTNPEVPDARYPKQDRPTPITAADSASVESVMAYIERVFGVRMPRSEVLFQAQFGPDGRLVRFPAPSAGSQVLAETERSEYTRIQAPALGIFAISNSVEELFPNVQTFDEENRRMAQEWSIREQKRSDWQISRFRDELRNSTVVEIPHANHYIHYTKADQVERLMRDFLSR